MNFKGKKKSSKFLYTIWTPTLGYCFPKDGSGVMVVCKIILGGMLTSCCGLGSPPTADPGWQFRYKLFTRWGGNPHEELMRSETVRWWKEGGPQKMQSHQVSAVGSWSWRTTHWAPSHTREGLHKTVHHFPLTAGEVKVFNPPPHWWGGAPRDVNPLQAERHRKSHVGPGASGDEICSSGGRVEHQEGALTGCTQQITQGKVIMLPSQCPFLVCRIAAVAV